MATLDLTNNFGALLIGITVSAALFGVTCTQVFFYFQNYPSDDIFTKVTVAILFVCEALHSALSIHAIYYYIVLNYMNPTGLLKVTWTITLTIGISDVITTIVHAFYTRRVYHLSRKNIPLTVILIVLDLARFGMGIAIVVRAFQLEYFTAVASIIGGFVDAGLALAVVVDIIIAASLCYFLHVGRSGVKSTNTVINKLIAYAINNGILTSVFDILTLAVFVAGETDSLVYLSVFQVVGNLYTNSVMATLNSRRAINQAGLDILSDSGSATTTFRAVPGMALGTQNSGVFSTDGKGGVILSSVVSFGCLLILAISI